MGGNDPKELRPGPKNLDWVFETTILSAFALAGRLDIVREPYADHATWTLVVHVELARGMRDEPRLGDAVAADWLGEPRSVLDTARVENLRQRLGGGPRDDRHLGEATCIVLAEQIGAGVLSDDRDAKHLAEALKIPTGTTVSVLLSAVREGQIAAKEASELLAELIDRYGRRLPRLSTEQFSSQ